MAKKPLERVIAVVGSATELARLLGVTKQAVSQWALRDIPVERVGDIEQLTGIPRAELRPDIFGVR